ncbi:MAG TPA: glutaredoxin domain-containing protein [Candidatus Tumulicola sp.]|jgi:monothiol glutaredoxin|nr:glutaredoxin domain-containing protein [Candidatus Tumulicola sp.]
MTDDIKQSIEKDIGDHTILVYGKGTKSAPRCGFTHETIEFFNELGYPFEVIDALADPEKREALSEMTNWPTLPKVFIAGKFYGDTDILAPMRESGELLGVLEDAFKTPA